MTDIWQKLQEETRPVYIYGTGNGADKLMERLNGLGIKIKGVFASDGFVRERTFRGFKVQSLKAARTADPNLIALLSFGTSRIEVIEQIKKLQKEITLFMPEVPVIGTTVFDLKFAQKHKNELEKVYKLLADEKSKQTFYNMVMFKLTGELAFLFECEASEEECFNELLKLKDGNSFLDLGAYNGDTALQFAKRIKKSKITALEPDKKSFKKLMDNTKELDITYINAALSSEVGVANFSTLGSRGSKMGEGEKIDTITVDSLDAQFDYINFDVEGAELEGIIGAKETITTTKPKMLISCYHKSEDYFTIPLKVLEFNPDYKVYMRHFPSIPAWDTVFYFI